MRTRAALTAILGLTLFLGSASWAQETAAPASASAGSPEAPSVDADQFAPVPEGARGPAIPQDKGYLVEEIQDGLYWVTNGIYQAMFLTTGEGVIAVDAPPTLGDSFLAAIEEITEEPVTHVVYSHAHYDHIGAAHLFPDDAQYIAHQATADLLAEVDDPSRPKPTATFEGNHTLTVGSQTLQLDYHGVNHQPGNIFIYAPQQRVLMLVDVVFPGWVPFKYLALSDYVPGYEAAHARALEYDFDTFIGGHLTRLGTRQDVELQQQFVQDLKQAAGQALEMVDFTDIAQETGFENPWLLFEVYYDTVANRCTEMLTPNWVERLGGADVFIASHCWTMVESLHVDYGKPGE